MAAFDLLEDFVGGFKGDAEVLFLGLALLGEVVYALDEAFVVGWWENVWAGFVLGVEFVEGGAGGVDAFSEGGEFALVLFEGGFAFVLGTLVGGFTGVVLCVNVANFLFEFSDGVFELCDGVFAFGELAEFTVFEEFVFFYVLAVATDGGDLVGEGVEVGFGFVNDTGIESFVVELLVVDGVLVVNFACGGLVNDFGLFVKGLDLLGVGFFEARLGGFEVLVVLFLLVDEGFCFAFLALGEGVELFGEGVLFGFVFCVAFGDGKGLFVFKVGFVLFEVVLLF